MSKQAVYWWWPSKPALLADAANPEVSVTVTADLGADLRSRLSAISADVARPEVWG
ncbi:hypothetical protein AB0O14_10050 [Microbacterium foliorum]